MNDKNIIDQIDKLAREEHEIMQRESHGKASDAEKARVRQLEALLDQCWDLLRQRRAKREFGQNPDEAEVRDAKTIKGY